MSPITFDTAAMQSIALFENITRAKVKDCIIGNNLTFVVEPGEAAKAIGKGASTLHRAEQRFKKKIKIIEYSADPAVFVRNVIAPLKVASTVLDNDVVTISDPDTKVKGMIIGRESSNLNRIKELVSRYFPQLKDIVVK